jgi:hypothetical protein
LEGQPLAVQPHIAQYKKLDLQNRPPSANRH